MDEPGSNIWLYVKGSEMKGSPVDFELRLRRLMQSVYATNLPIITEYGAL